MDIKNLAKRATLFLLPFALAACGGGDEEAPNAPAPPLTCESVPPSSRATEINDEYNALLNALSGNQQEFATRDGLLSSTFSLGAFIQNGVTLQTLDSFQQNTESLGSQTIDSDFVYASSTQHSASLGILGPFSLGLDYAETTNYEGVVSYDFRITNVELRQVQNPGSAIDDNQNLAIGSDSFVYGVYEATIENTITLDANCDFNVNQEASLIVDIISGNAGSSSAVSVTSNNQISIRSEVPVPIAYLIRDVDVPPPRLNVGASVEQGGIVILDWDPVAGINNYRVFFSSTSGFEPGDPGVQESSATGNSVQISGDFSPGEQIFFRVFPSAGGNVITSSESEAAVTIPDTAPSEALSITASNTQQGGVLLNWSAPSRNDANQYRIFRGAAPDFTGTQISDISRSSDRDAFRFREYIDTNVQPSTEYRYWVQYGNFLSPPFSPISNQIQITSSANVNLPPLAEAGEDQAVFSRNTVVLNGEQSNDLESDPLTFLWEQVDSSGAEVDIINATNAIATFVAPDVTENTTLRFRLTVSDGNSSGSDEMRVTVEPPDSTNNPPNVSVFATPETVVEGNAVVLDATSSFDPDGQSISYTWRQIDSSGLNVGVENNTAGTVSFIAPIVDQNTVLQFQVDVSDGTATSSGIVSVTVTNEGQISGDIAVDVLVTPNPVVPGEPVRLDFYVTNRAAFEKTNLQLSFPYPADLLNDLDERSIANSGDCVGGGVSRECDVIGDQLVWAVNNFAEQTTRRFSIHPVVQADASADSLLEVIAEVQENEVPVANTNKIVSVVSERLLQLSLMANKDPVLSGEDVSYELHFSNTSQTEALENIQLDYSLPDGTTLTEASGSPQINDNTLTWQIGTLVPGEAGKQIVTVRAGSNITTGTQLNAEATMSSSQTNSTATSVEAVVTLENNRALEMDIELSPQPVEPGGVLWTELVITNSSLFDRSNIAIMLHYPARFLEDVDERVISDEGDCVGLGGSRECDLEGNRLLWAIETLEAQSSERVSLLPFVKSEAVPGNLIEFVAGVYENNVYISEIRKTVPIVRERDLQLSLNANTNAMQTGDTINFDLLYGMTEQSAISENAQLTLELPPEFNAVEGSGSPVINGNTLSWQLGTLDPGQSGKQTVSATVSNNAEVGSHLNAELTITDATGNTTNENAVNSIVSANDIQLTFDVSPETVVPGGTLNVGVTITNTSSFNRSNLAIHLRYPAQHLEDLDQILIGDNADCAGLGVSDECDFVGDWITWEIGSLAANASRTVNFSPQVFSTLLPGTIIEFQAEVEENNVWRTDTRKAIRVISP